MEFLLETTGGVITKSSQKAMNSYHKDVNDNLGKIVAKQLFEESNDSSWFGKFPKRQHFSSEQDAVNYLNDRNNYHRRNYNIMYDNTITALEKLTESSIVNRANNGEYANLVLPILSRVYPNTISDKIVCTRAMNGPITLVPRREGIYLSNKGRTTAGNYLVRDFDPNYASEQVSGEVIRVADGVNFGGAGTAFSGHLKYNPVQKNDNVTTPLSPRRFSVEIRDQSPTTGVIAQTLRDNGNGGWIRTDTGAAIAGASINYDNGEINALLFPVAPAANNVLVAVYFQITDGGIGTLKAARVGQDIQLDQVVAETFQLQAQVSIQAMQDVQALYGQDPIEQIRSDVAKELSLGTDRIILQDLRVAGSAFITPFNAVPVPGLGERERYGDVISAMDRASGQMHARNKRARANFAVVSPDMMSLLMQFQTNPLNWPVASSLDPSGAFGAMNPRMSPMVHGQGQIMVRGGYTVYEDITQTTEGSILLGVSSQDYLDSGYLFAPYIPLYISPASSATDAETGTLKYLFMTRFGRKLLRPDFYASVLVTGFGS